ncbi:MAG: tyrosine-type recombinase/integrase, partial [Candidatus Micrarchaeaceae archaeon]
MITFKDRSDAWLQELSTRKRGAVKPASLVTFKSCVKRLNTIIGMTDLAEIHNGVARLIVEQLVQEQLAPATINLLLMVLKAVVASYVNPVTGEPVYPRVWKSSFIDAPRIEKQEQPIYTRAEIEAMLKTADDRARVLIAFAAGTGMRLGEILDCRINSETVTSLDLENHVVMVRTSRWNNVSQAPKTAAAVRPIDLCAELVNVLTQFVGSRASGFLFESRPGNACHPTTLRKQMAPLGAASFHAYRRFRITFLRASLIPDDLIRLWAGHSGATVTDRYAKIENRMDVRRQYCEVVGLGFNLSHVPV